MAGGDRPLFPQHALARGHVVVVHGVRSGHGTVFEPQHGRVLLQDLLQPERVGVLIEADHVLGPVREGADHHAGQAVLALEPHQEVREGRVTQDQAAGPVRDEVGPGGTVARPHRRFDDLEVLGFSGVGADEETVAPLVHAVAQSRFADRHQPRLGIGAAQVHETALAGIVTADGDDREVA